MSDNEVVVSQVTVGEYIPFRGVLFRVADSDGHTVTLEAVTVTAGYIKSQSRKWRKEHGKHWRRKARRDLARDVNKQRQRYAAQCRAWLKAETAWQEAQGYENFGATVVSPEMFNALLSDDPALD